MQTATIAAFGRLLIAALFILSGLGKLADPAGMQGYIASVGLPLPAVGYFIAISIEVGVGLMFLVGFKTRIAAGILAAFTIATALAFHNGLGDQNTFVHFFKNISIAGGLLQVVAFGGGSFSLDARRLKSPGPAAQRA